MTTIKRFRDKYRIELREDDHNPPHVHVTGGGIDVVVDLGSGDVREERLPKAIRGEVLGWIAANLDSLREEWKKWHP